METRQRLEHLLAAKPARPPRVDAAQPVALYGAGQLGQMALEFLRHVGVNVSHILDRRATGALDGVPIFPAETPPKNPAQPILVTIGNAAYLPIAEALENNGWKNILPFYDYAEAFRSQHPLNNGWFSDTLGEEDKVKIIAVHDGWADDWSRAAYLQFLAWRITREEWAFDNAPIIPENRYFIPEITAHLTNKEILVDGGAYDGRMYKSFCALAGGIREAHLFEPDPENFAALKATVGKDKHAHCYTEALGEQEEKTAFQAGFGMASRITGAGTHTRVVRLDDLKLAPSYLKLHLEGGEYAALSGALDTIRTHRPLVAVTVYHNRDGLWKTAALLMQSFPDYRFYFRLHSWCGTGALIYGVPL